MTSELAPKSSLVIIIFCRYAFSGAFFDESVGFYQKNIRPLPFFFDAFYFLVYMKRLFYVTIGLMAMFAVFSCTDEAKPETPGDKTPVQTAIELSNTELTIVIGESSVLAAKITPSSKAADIIWQTADPEIASLTETVSGQEVKSDISAPAVSAVRIDGNSIGRTTVIAVIDNIIEKCTVDVVAKEAAAVTLNKTELALNVGESETLAATVEPEDVTDPSISWTSDNPDVAAVVLGEVKALSAGTAIITAACSGKTAECKVTVSNINAETLVLDIQDARLAVGETVMLTATVYPADATDKNVTWSVSNGSVASVECIDGSLTDDIVNGKVTALAEGKTTVTASLAGLKAVCNVTVVPKEEPVTDPKIGDYYYSDGTWSDGGLISINEDGTNPVWAAEKPAPIAGKTVIGIIFQTNRSRMHSVDKENGFTHGYVVCTKSAHAPGKTETMYSFDDGISFMTGKKLASSWYTNLNGYTETMVALQQYAGKVDQIPAFDWTTTDFSPSAPAGTSGWYLPSTGQMWDMMANLCGEEVAEYLYGLRNYGYDITWENTHTVSYDVIAKFNSYLSLVPDEQKEELAPVTYGTVTSKTVFLWCSTLYDDSDGVACCFEIGTDGSFWPGCEWVNNPNVARPILAF